MLNFERIIRPAEEQRVISDRVTVVVCEHFGISTESVYGRDMSRLANTARALTIFILHRDLKCSISFLSREYGRNKRTIYHTCEQTDNYIKWYDDYRRHYESIRASLAAIDDMRMRNTV